MANLNLAFFQPVDFFSMADVDDPNNQLADRAQSKMSPRAPSWDNPQVFNRFERFRM